MIQLYVYGEMHFFKNEVTDIRSEIISKNPEYILLENYDDDALFYKDNTDSKILELEPASDLKNLSLVKQFFTREKRMVENLEAVLIQKIKDRGNIKICVQVGDTHLRTIETKVLGSNTFRKYLDSLLVNKNIKMYIKRSKNKEIL